MYSTNKHTTTETTKALIAKTECYELQYDEASNRIYFTLSGYWKDKEFVPDYIDDWRKAITLTRSNFTVLSDLRTMITHPPSLNSLHLEVQNLIQENGVSRMAQLNPADRIATLQISQIADQSSIPLSCFTSLQDAEAWLDDIQ